MIELADNLNVALVSASTATNATATAAIDTRGYKYLEVLVKCDTAASTTSNPAVLKLSQSDTTDATNYSDISGCVGDTDFTIANAETTKTTYHDAVFKVNLKGKKRYVKFSCTPAGAAQIVFATAVLSRGDKGASTAALNGALVTATG